MRLKAAKTDNLGAIAVEDRSRGKGLAFPSVFIHSACRWVCMYGFAKGRFIPYSLFGAPESLFEASLMRGNGVVSSFVSMPFLHLRISTTWFPLCQVVALHLLWPSFFPSYIPLFRSPYLEPAYTWICSHCVAGTRCISCLFHVPEFPRRLCPDFFPPPPLHPFLSTKGFPSLQAFALFFIPFVSLSWSPRS